jgi:hypothetical protein
MTRVYAYTGNFEEGEVTLFEDNRGEDPILKNTSWERAIHWFDILLENTNGFSLVDEMNNVSKDLSKKGITLDSIYDLPESIVELLIQKFGLHIEREGND